jgi:nicotinamidase-related amidase
MTSNYRNSIFQAMQIVLPIKMIRWLLQSVLQQALLLNLTMSTVATKLEESHLQSFHGGLKSITMDEKVSKQPPSILPLKGESTALLIVDVQPEYWSKSPSIREDFPNFETNIARTIELCRKRNVKIIWVRADYRYHHSPWLNQFEKLKGNRADTQSEIPFDPYTDKNIWETFATPRENEIIIAKHSWNSASNTPLLDYLKVNDIQNVLVCGLLTSVCVQHSAFSVFEAGYRTLLVEDACGDRGIDRHRAAISLYGNYMYELVDSVTLHDELIWPQAPKPTLITSERNSTISYRLLNV